MANPHAQQSQPTLIVSPSQQDRFVVSADGQLLAIPATWELLPPGDAAMTRRVKAAGPSWTVQEMKGRKKFSRGVWAPAGNIEHVRRSLDTERATDSYAKRRASESIRREIKQTAYVEDFRGAVLEFLRFAPKHAELADKLAAAVTIHATPVGSGTVARTQRIPLEQRAESAVIAWLRHQTTAYDQMKIQRIKGERREVRRQLAAISRLLLARYRDAGSTASDYCPLRQALGC